VGSVFAVMASEFNPGSQHDYTPLDTSDDHTKDTDSAPNAPPIDKLSRADSRKTVKFGDAARECTYARPHTGPGPECSRNNFLLACVHRCLLCVHRVTRPTVTPLPWSTHVPTGQWHLQSHTCLYTPACWHTYVTTATDRRFWRVTLGWSAACV
jgi:hypothetical protein